MKINGFNIEMTRGDSDSITVSCTKDGISHDFTAGDIVYFTVKKSIYDSVKVIQKIITEFADGKAVIPILPADTRDLSFSTYVYDVQINFFDGSVNTVIPPSSFTILPEVTCE